MADPYSRQIAPRDATATLPFARPETFGAGLANAVGDAAMLVARTDTARRAEEIQLERDKQASAAALQLARIQEEAVAFAAEQQGQTDPGGAGYTRQIEAFLQDKEAQFLGSIGDDRVREAMAPRFASFRAQTVTSALSWEKGQSVAFAVSNYGELTKIRANQAARATPERFVELLKEQEQDTELLSGVAPDIRLKLLRGATEEMVVGFLTGRSPQEQMALLDSGRFDALDPDVVRQLKAGAEVDIRREKTEREARMRAIRAEVTATVEGVLKDVSDGLPVTDAVLADTQSRAEAAAKDAKAAGLEADAIGLEGKVKDLFDARIRNQANREFQSVGVVGIDAEVKRLNTKIAEAGDKANRADIIRRDHLEQLRGKRREMIESDPADFASRLGIEWKPLALDDPAALSGSIAERKRAAAATAAAAGLPVQLLTDAEAQQFKANIGTREGRSLLLNVAGAFGGDANKVIDQVAPDQPLLRHLVGLTPTQRTYALEGASLIDAKAYKPPEDLDGAIRARIGTALNGFSASARAGVIETARAYYAYQKSRSGDDGTRLDERTVMVAVDRALGNIEAKRGQEGGRGGLALWRGDARFALPDTMTEAEFRRRISGNKLSGFFFGDGKTPITAQQLRDQFIPVAIGGTRYQWQRGPNGSYALDSRGKPAVLDVGKLRDPGEPTRAAQGLPRGNLMGR